MNIELDLVNLFHCVSKSEKQKAAEDFAQNRWFFIGKVNKLRVSYC